ncbi:tRNA pseudouridine(55) synthase TruB [Nakamurella sp. YIM 132087]|uniref:tRNA pseudouridine synthase B n=1 Tax=Nakamurella alba TaxID=2665158 RepID=A0A7K1FKF0_9ACTN|nr:tRNA pseudouridine(55) synthase TruB [Nakamurella alba]MTD13723.1 tRNA pseudouridine(55) synthase TruB [Nakamurella alba]
MTRPPDGGLLLVDKPVGCTSHDVVGRVRRIMATRRVGHAGTLDPMATGLLLVAVERSTKLLSHLVLTGKSYAATVRLGATTVSDDVEGEVLTTADPAALAAVTDAAVTAAVAPLTGDILQRPSSVSAIKVDGRRAYDLVREGVEVDLPARPVRVDRFEIIGPVRRDPVGRWIDLDVEVDCSSGTYIRALARDLGESLGVGAHLTRLRRTAVGPFTVDTALDVFDGRPPAPRGERNPDPTDELRTRAAGLLLPPEAVVRAVFPVRQADATEAGELAFGRGIKAGGDPATTAVLHDGRLMALVRNRGVQARPELVWAPAG